jgi:hypothetical protein
MYFCGETMFDIDDNNQCCTHCGCLILVINICLPWIWGGVATVIVISVIVVSVVTVIIVSVVSGGLCSVCNTNRIKCM